MISGILTALSGLFSLIRRWLDNLEQQRLIELGRHRAVWEQHEKDQANARISQEVDCRPTDPWDVVLGKLYAQADPTADPELGEANHVSQGNAGLAHPTPRTDPPSSGL